MITVVPRESRFFADRGWLQSFWLFSFDEYVDPENDSFGVLRVFNDDTIAARSGFPMHGHRDMEIVTLVFDGVLTHRDSLGSVGSVRAGEVQRMSAGSGIVHSEMNVGDVPVSLYQVWFVPRSSSTPSYAQKSFSSFENILVPLVSGLQDAPLQMNANATMFRGDFTAGKTFDFSLDDNHGLFCYVRSGKFNVNGKILREGDRAKVVDEKELLFRVEESGIIIMVEVVL